MRSPRSVLLVAGLVALDLLIVVVAFALSHRDGAPADAGGSAAPSVASAQDDVAPIQGPLVLAASDEGAIVRATRGSCDERAPVAARVWTSTGAGGELTERKVAGLQESLGVTYRGRSVSIVGATTSCEVVGFESSDGGRTWQRGAVPRDAWWLDTDTSSGFVHGPVPNGEVNVVCIPTSLSTLGAGQSARVVCQGQNVVTVDRGLGQSTGSAPVQSPSAATAVSGDRLLVLAEQPDCSAALVRVSKGDAASGGDGDADSVGSRVACLSRSAAGLGLASGGGRVFAQVGYRLLVSTDGGERFTAYDGDPVTAAADADQ
ncbi:hypothetical protein GCM10011519_27030 [Marmoricola endophyticus]|uniref:Uncharacterized protein n=1 Tax=Marmoricola endophyticus TaxID=2040280 RepID=A0A917F5D0_9ACTN|nr:hypothetical protein [Marmoricola endophyticus]GGF51632.1 hypothetical protein GCM10011519_27030 [Marmoricola endophyticus]